MKQVGVLTLATILMVGVAIAQVVTEASLKTVPPGWCVKESFVASRAQTAAIEKRLGYPIKKLSNTILSAHGEQIQVNILECHSDQDAIGLHKTILKMKGHPAFCLRKKRTVVEFVGNDVALAIKAAYELGFKAKPSEARYRISLEIVPLKRCDYMAFNKLSNLFFAISENPDDENIRLQIAKLSERFQFGKEINLRTCCNGKVKPIYRFKPDSIKAEVAGQGGTTTYTFKNIPERLGVPYVLVEAEVTTNDEAITPSTRKVAGELLTSTEFWPADDSEILNLAKKIIKGCQRDEDKVEAILKWLSPDKNIKFGGPVGGSRWGVKKVLKQRFGQCWDFSDCFVTLARASGIPCRQVAGWLYGSCGHIWAEVLLDGKGWQQVDPTGGSILKCGIYYIPYFTSEDGSMPILYVSMPKIEMLNQ